MLFLDRPDELAHPLKYRRHAIIRAVFFAKPSRHTTFGNVVVVSFRHLMPRAQKR
jgi:hypothetical protein